MLVFGGFEVLGGGQLHHLAFGDDRARRRQDVERLERADVDHHAERLAEQEVADQHARLVAPDHACRLLAAAQAALVDDVVMQQRRGMHEFDAGGELDVTIAGIAEHLGGGERHHRPQPFASRRDQMIGDLGDHLDVGARLGKDQLVDTAHVGRGQIEQLLDRCGFALSVSDIEDDTQGGTPELIGPTNSQPFPTQFCRADARSTGISWASGELARRTRDQSVGRVPRRLLVSAQWIWGQKTSMGSIREIVFDCEAAPALAAFGRRCSTAMRSDPTTRPRSTVWRSLA